MEHLLNGAGFGGGADPSPTLDFPDPEGPTLDEFINDDDIKKAYLDPELHAILDEIENDPSTIEKHYKNEKIKAVIELIEKKLKKYLPDPTDFTNLPPEALSAMLSQAGGMQNLGAMLGQGDMQNLGAMLGQGGMQNLGAMLGQGGMQNLGAMLGQGGMQNLGAMLGQGGMQNLGAMLGQGGMQNLGAMLGQGGMQNPQATFDQVGSAHKGLPFTK